MSVQKSANTTPPQSFTGSPPTPPATEEKIAASISLILAEVRCHKDGNSLAAGKHWLRFSLDVDHYRDLPRQLRKANLWDHFEHNLRHDYFPTAKLYVLRMPGSLHGSLGSYIIRELLDQLSTIAQSESSSALFAENIENSASARITFEESEYGPHEPDASFQHLEAQFPGVILEVSYSQKKKDLPRLADEYILGSNANIRVMVGIDIEYKGSKKASISIWRPHIGVNQDGEIELSVVQTVTDQLFRDELGNVILNPQASLDLQLEDFGTEAFAARFPNLTETIHISTEKLFTLLERAEFKEERIKKGKGLKRSNQPWGKKRRRNSTPPEQLASDREGRFVEQEQRAAKTAMRDDVSYRAGSSELDLEL